MAERRTAPLDDAILAALCKLIDDAQAGHYRQPSHDDLTEMFRRTDLLVADPKQRGDLVGKAKRLRAVLHHAVDRDLAAGERLTFLVVQGVKGVGGFRHQSENYVGAEAIKNAADAFRSAGYKLGSDGSLGPLVLDSLSGQELTAALETYAERARAGAEDAALLVGTSKDLMEATAAHVLVQKSGSYPQRADFPSLMGMAFAALGLATDADPERPGEHPRRRVERAMLELACSINRLRNKQGSGHGRPWLPDVTDSEAKHAVEQMGAIVARMLDALAGR